MSLRIPRSAGGVVVWLAVALTVSPVSAEVDPVQRQTLPDSAGLRHAAEEAQARFERQRRRLANRTPGGYRGECDVTVGRMCLRFGPGDDWWPEPEPAELLAARDTLLVQLYRVAREIPGDGWVSGQRVAYLAELHRLDAAMEVAEACASDEPGWCPALRGLVFHLRGRFSDAEKAFRIMLAALDSAVAREWEDPSLLLDGDGRDALEGASPPERARLASATWRWADPLFLAPGNDRWTEHMARRVMERIREDAENPYGLPWAGDLSEMLLRYGWEYGWERVDPAPAMSNASPTMRGQEHPHARSFMPPGQALTRLGRTGPRAWTPSSRPNPRTGYAPAYAPVFLPAEGGLFRFPRGDSLVLVAWLSLPRDTSVHADHDHPALTETLRWRGLPPALGLFADPPGAVASRTGAERTGTDRGAVRLVLPPGRFLVSAEVWAPGLGRAGRIRQGVVWDGVPPDVPTLSDLVLLDDPVGEAGRVPSGGSPGRLPAAVESSPPSAGGETGPPPAGDSQGLPTTLAEALPVLREGTVSPGQAVALAWELNGVGEATGPVRYQLELRRSDEGFLRRAGRLLGLVGSGPGVELTWTEPAPGDPGPVFRTTRLVLPAEVEPGRYRLRLQVGLPGRETLERSRELRVVDSAR